MTHYNDFLSKLFLGKIGRLNHSTRFTHHHALLRCGIAHAQIRCHPKTKSKVRPKNGVYFLDTLKDLVSRICVLEKGVLNMIEQNELPGSLVSQAIPFAGRGRV